MEKLLFTLSRMGSGALTEILGFDTVELLGKIDLVSLTASALAELVVAKNGPKGILLDRNFRARLFKAMLVRDGERLLALLGKKPSACPSDDLSKIGFSANSEKARILFEFFGCALEEDTSGPSSLPISRINPQYRLFSHQRKAYLRTLEILQRPENPRVLLHMPTGAGKTRTAMNVIANHLRSFSRGPSVVVWLAHSEELCDQAVEEFEKAWGILGDRAVQVYQNFAGCRVGSLDNVTDGFLVAGLNLFYNQSLTQASEFLNLSRRTSLIVMDEAHQAVAPTYKHLLSLLCPMEKTPLLGLSATPGRSFLNAGADLELAEFFHRQKVTLEVEGYDNPMQYLQHEGYLAKVITTPLRYAPSHRIQLTAAEARTLEEGMDIPSSILNQLGEDQLRNLLIISAILREVQTKSKILVFACSVAHAEMLADLLRLKGVKAASITSRTPSSEREERIRLYRSTDELQVLTNFGVLTTGFDAPKTKVAFICRPTQSVVLYSQMVGRAARGTQAGGNEECRVFTVVDNLPGVKDVADAFTFWEDIWT